MCNEPVVVYTPAQLDRAVVARQVLVALGLAQPADGDACAGQADDEHGAPHFGHRAEVDPLELLFERGARRVRIVVQLDELHVQDEGERGGDGGHEPKEEHECHRILLAAAELERVDYEEGDRHDCDVMVSIGVEERGERVLAMYMPGISVPMWRL